MKWWHILLFTGLVVMRFAYLDQDAPVYQFANVCQEDEPYYSQGAILKLCANEGRTVKGFEKTKGEVFDMYNRYITYTSLKIFGNNYWGLRIPDVLASILFILLIYSIFKTINPASDFISLFVIILLTNFYLFDFSRYNNPQIFSVLTITLALWIIVKYGYEKPLPLIVTGFVATFAVFFVYILNFFLLAGVGLFVLVKAIAKRKLVIPVYFMIGVSVCFLFLTWSLSLIGCDLGTIYDSIKANGAGDNGVLTDTSTATSIFINIYKSISSIISTGYFRYQLVLLFGVLAAIPMLIMKASHKDDKDRSIALLLIFLIDCQFVQNYFAVNYPFKKMLVDIPITILALFVVTNGTNLKAWFNNIPRKVIMACWFIVALLLCLFNFKINKSPVYWGYTGVGCFGATPAWFNWLNVGTCVALTITLIFILFYSIKLSRTVVKIALVVSIASNFILIYNTFLINRKYEIRDCLVDLKPLIHDKIVIGSFPLTFQLYTGCKPGLHGYEINYITSSKQAVSDSMLVNRKTDFLIDKVMPSQSVPHTNDSNLKLVKVYNFDCYSYYVYKNSHE
ncbi:MAG TPA: glycosyltransferase family 39 protein [Bacteroidia bacterium]|nr:glycosyltransferase family 39 protein [Bacteroidia bacterium]